MSKIKVLMIDDNVKLIDAVKEYFKNKLIEFLEGPSLLPHLFITIFIVHT